jgi:hypothetical protein
MENPNNQKDKVYFNDDVNTFPTYLISLMRLHEISIQSHDFFAQLWEFPAPLHEFFAQLQEFLAPFQEIYAQLQEIPASLEKNDLRSGKVVNKKPSILIEEEK